jgi:type IV fimbrial biogenesis protein FimT
MGPHGSRGITLLELLVTLSIVVILALLAVPFSSLVQRARAETTMHGLLRMIQIAKSHAITSGERTMLCGTNDHMNCQRDWDSTAVIVFVDKNVNRKRDEAEPIIAEDLLENGSVHWNHLHEWMQFRPDGSTVEYGTYTFCPTDRQPGNAHQLTINAAGRVYFSRDRDGDGIDEDNRSGEPLTCPAS